MVAVVTPGRMSALVETSTPMKASTSTSTSTSKYIMNAAGLYVCPHCGDTKARKNTMYYHIKKHLATPDYVCPEPGCDKAYYQKSALDQHRLQAHTAVAEKPMWTCPCCEHQSPVKSNVVIHIGRMHGSPWIPAVGEGGGVCCPGCSKSMASPTAYFYHAMSCFGVPLAPVAGAGHKKTVTVTVELDPTPEARESKAVSPSAEKETTE